MLMALGQQGGPWSEQIPGGMPGMNGGMGIPMPQQGAPMPQQQPTQQAQQPMEMPQQVQGNPRYSRPIAPASNEPESGAMVPNASQMPPIPQVQAPYGGMPAPAQGKLGQAMQGMGNNIAFGSLSPELQVKVREDQMEAQKANSLAAIRENERMTQLRIEQARVAEAQRWHDELSTRLNNQGRAATGSGDIVKDTVTRLESTVNPDTGQPLTTAQIVAHPDYQAAVQAAQALKTQEKPEKPDNPQQQYIEKYGLEAGTAKYAAATQKPERDPKQLGVDPTTNKVIELRPGMTVPDGTKTMTQFEKGPTADEQRRADLSRNVNENLDHLQDIIKRRPDLFGPLAGKVTRVKIATGSNDPDIGALSVIRDQLGIAAVGAHAMRNFQGAESLGKVMSAIDMGPEAANSAISTVRRSVGTFQKDAGEQPGSAPRGAKGGSPTSDQAAPAPQGKPVRVNGQIVGYTMDGKTMTPVQPQQ